MRRAPQFGQKPRRLQLNATSFSGIALDAQESVFEANSFQERLEFFVDEVGE